MLITRQLYALWSCFKIGAYILWAVHTKYQINTLIEEILPFIFFFIRWRHLFKTLPKCIKNLKVWNQSDHFVFLGILREQIQTQADSMKSLAILQNIKIYPCACNMCYLEQMQLILKIWLFYVLAINQRHLTAALPKSNQFVALT